MNTHGKFGKNRQQNKKVKIKTPFDVNSTFSPTTIHVPFREQLFGQIKSAVFFNTSAIIITNLIELYWNMFFPDK